MCRLLVWSDHSVTCLCIGVQGSRDQLEEVWEENDGMDREDFDPKTFFYMHGTAIAMT